MCPPVHITVSEGLASKFAIRLHASLHINLTSAAANLQKLTDGCSATPRACRPTEHFSEAKCVPVTEMQSKPYLWHGAVEVAHGIFAAGLTPGTSWAC